MNKIQIKIFLDKEEERLKGLSTTKENIGIIVSTFHNKLKIIRENEIPITEKILKGLFNQSENVIDIQNIIDIDLNETDDLLP